MLFKVEGNWLLMQFHKSYVRAYFTCIYYFDVDFQRTRNTGPSNSPQVQFLR